MGNVKWKWCLSSDVFPVSPYVIKFFSEVIAFKFKSISLFGTFDNIYKYSFLEYKYSFSKIKDASLENDFYCAKYFARKLF